MANFEFDDEDEAPPSLRAVIADALGDSLGGVPASVYDTAAGDVLDRIAQPENRPALVAWLAVLGVDLADPANRAALVDGLVEAGVLEQAECLGGGTDNSGRLPQRYITVRDDGADRTLYRLADTREADRG
jgi:hypothetical protein